MRLSLGRLSFNSLFARVALILLINLILVQAVAFGLLNLEIEAFDLGIRRLPERIAGIVKQLDDAPAEQCVAAAVSQTSEEMTVTVHDTAMPSDIGLPGASPRAGMRESSMARPMLNELSLYLKLHIGEFLLGPEHKVVVLSNRGLFRLDAGPPPLPREGFGAPSDDEPPPGGPHGPGGPGGPGGPRGSGYEPGGPPPPQPGAGPAEPEPRAFRGGMRGPEAYGHVGIQLLNGCWAEVALHGPPPAFGWIRMLSRIGGFGLVIILCSLWFARSAARNLSQFSAAADAVGRSVEAPLLPETGPREVRLAAKAFNRMQERLRRFVNDRTQMLAAISHDLRTPLTRLRLRAEFVDDDAQRTKMLGDIAEMEAMISATLAFARDDAVREPRAPQDLDQLLDQLASDLCDGGYPVVYEPSGLVIVSCSAGGIRRALANLAENAVKYGGVARLSLEPADDLVTILIDDDGPGIPPEMAEQVFQPFFRLEGSRNRDTGGVGLGLSVARTIIRGHGGDIALRNRPEGGLRVTVTLPA
ncbi:MAG TPA: ATP-binding protein [Aliidongia sp.]|uniref:ATP-binding protein n=1 Tax=Aliidongia sp. TaxID=1914230 RepID=UPI002DDDB19E|nr:ATP-binding protein [Aliidongia sp.]HEV2673076.1 ATP-binding protein [Aliidongia sp.]